MRNVTSRAALGMKLCTVRRPRFHLEHLLLLNIQHTGKEFDIVAVGK
jgi:hypothetical protein